MRAAAVRDLADVLDVELEAKGQTRLLRDVELPLVGVLADMERPASPSTPSTSPTCRAGSPAT